MKRWISKSHAITHSKNRWSWSTDDQLHIFMVWFASTIRPIKLCQNLKKLNLYGETKNISFPRWIVFFEFRNERYCLMCEFREYAVMRATFGVSSPLDRFQPGNKTATQYFANITINQLIQQMFYTTKIIQIITTNVYCHIIQTIIRITTNVLRQYESNDTTIIQKITNGWKYK
jgi:hypothetical protein